MTFIPDKVEGCLDTVNQALRVNLVAGGGGGGGVVTQASGANLHVDVDNFPATQPVSLASAPSTPVTNANLANLDVLLSTRTKPADQQHVIIDTIPATAVTNAGLTNLDVALSTRTKPADQQHVIIDTIPSTAVTNAGLTNLDVALSTRLKPADTLAAVTSITNAVSVTPPTLTKGTQGATGFSVQELKDAGRVIKTYGASAVAGVTTEALITLTPYADLTAGSTATTFAVTAGKRLRLQTIVLTWRNNTAVAGGVTVRLRLLAGTVLVTSPVHACLNASTGLATIGSGQTAFIDLPDGLELSGTMQFGLTQLAVGAVVGFDVNVIGYEY